MTLKATYSAHHRKHAEGSIFIDKPGACTISLVGAASMTQAELNGYGEIFAKSLAGDNRPNGLVINDQEAAMILAGLRMIQRLGVQPPEEEVATNGGELDELGDDAIDDLCERINFGQAAPVDQSAAAADLIGQDDRALEEGWCLVEGAGGLLEIEIGRAHV